MVYLCIVCGFTGRYDNHENIDSLQEEELRKAISCQDHRNIFYLNYKKISNVKIIVNFIVFQCEEGIFITDFTGVEQHRFPVPLAFDSSKIDNKLIFLKRENESKDYVIEEINFEDEQVKTYSIGKILLLNNDNILFSVGKTFALLSDSVHLYRLIFTQSECSISQISLPGNSIITSISCGYAHATLLSGDHRVFTIGCGGRGQLGNGSTAETDSLIELDILHPLKIVQVVSGGWHSLALSDTGDLYSWGWNESGQVGVAQTLNDDSIRTHDDTTRTQNDTTRTQNGTTKYSQATPNQQSPPLVFLPTLLNTPIDLEFKALAVGSRHSVALCTNGSIFSWGWNGYKQLLLESPENVTQPTKVNFHGKFSCDSIVCGMWNTLIVQRNENITLS